MTLDDLLAQLIRERVIVAVEGERLRVRALLDESPLSEKTLALCRAHREELLTYARFAEAADRLLLESTHRLSIAWPVGCHLDEYEQWVEADKESHGTYWSLDLPELQRSISRREQVALDIFAAFRKERAR